MSVTTAWNRYSASVNADDVKRYEPDTGAVAATPVSTNDQPDPADARCSCTDAMPTPVSDAPVTKKVGDVCDVVRSDDEDPRSADASRVKTPLSGLVASTTKVYPVDGALTLPLASVALIVTEWLPSARSTDGATENAPDIPDDDADPMAVVPS